MASSQFSPSSSEVATDLTVLDVSIAELRTMLFEAESRITDYLKAVAPESLRFYSHFAGLVSSYLHEVECGTDDGKVTREYLARSLNELLPTAKGLLSLSEGLPAFDADSVEAHLSDLDDAALEKLERAIGEILAVRQPESKQSVQPVVADAINRVRMGFLLNSFFVFTPPASLDEPWAKRTITSIKRALHRLTPAELISIGMFLSRAADVPLPDVYIAHIVERAKQQRQASEQVKAKRGGRQ